MKGDDVHNTGSQGGGTPHPPPPAPVSVGTRVCIQCNVEKSLTEFPRPRRYPAKRCAACTGLKPAGIESFVRPEPKPVVEDDVEQTVSRDQGSPVDSQQDAAQEVKLDEFGLPPSMIDGKPNAAYYREVYKKLNRMMLAAVHDGDRIPFNYESAIKGVDREAEAAGFEPRVLRDQRTDAQVIEDSVLRLTSSPTETWELFDEELNGVISAMNDAVTKTERYVQKMVADAEMPLIPMEGPTSPKAFAERLGKVLLLRKAARDPDGKVDHLGVKVGTARKFAYQASWVLRTMVYCGRSTMAQANRGSAAKSVYKIGDHHAKMCADVWEARNGVRYGPPTDNPRGPSRVNPGEMPYTGCIVVIAPGHGKSDFGRFEESCNIVRNPYTQLLINHAKSTEAEKNLTNITTLFSRETPTGRRFVSLFGVEVAQSSKTEMRVKLKERLRQPTVSASGVHTKVSGSNASDEWWDDPVDQSERESPTERDRTFDVLNGTWLRRLRGSSGTFVLCTTTMWHKADSVCRFIDLAASGKLFWRVSIQRCGGPKSDPPFYALWHDMYPPGYLRSVYMTMKNPGLYSAMFMCNPVAEESRIVKKVRLYDPDTDEHRRFMESSTKYLSLDPAATRSERSDNAGMLYAAMGQIVVERVEDARTIRSSEKRLRLLSYEAIPATQSDLVRHTIDVCRIKPVDAIMVETRSGYHATADMFENYHGITVRRLDPKNRDKEERLRAAAPAIEDANAADGLRAVVEFPGVRDERGELVIDPRFQSLLNEILDFGVCATDEGVDCLTQMVNDLASDLGVGSGGVVSAIARKQAGAADPRLEELHRQWQQTNKQRPIQDQTAEWLAKSWSMPPMSMPGDMPVVGAMG